MCSTLASSHVMWLLYTLTRLWLYVQLLQSAMKLMHSAWRDYGAMLLVNTDHNGHDLHKADHERLQYCKDRLPDTLSI